MEKDEILQKLKEVGTLEDEVQRREVLSELTTTLSDELTAKEIIAKDLEKLKEDNEKLREANMNLFLRVGEQKTPEEKAEESTGIKKEEEPEPRKYEDLFDEKGVLK